MKAKTSLMGGRARPIRTEYRGADAVGHSATLLGALKAALPRVINGEFQSATIFDQYGLVTFTIKRKGIDTRVRDMRV